MADEAILTLEDAVDAALAESDTAESDEIPEASPAEGEDELVSEDQAEPEDDQAEDADSQEELFSDIEVEEPQADLESMTFDIPTVDDPVTLDELKQGYLRQSDYTRKTQELSREREQLSQATKLIEALQRDPQGTVRSLADAAGFQLDGPVSKLELSPFQTATAVEEEIAKRVEEAVANHPDVQEASLAKAERVISGEFDRIQGERDIVLGPKDRQRVLDKAAALGTTNLELVVDSMLQERARKRETVDSLRQAAPSKPRTGVRAEDKSNLPDKVETLQDAMALALAELEG